MSAGNSCVFPLAPDPDSGPWSLSLASSEDDFRARGLRARGELSKVLPSEGDPSLAPVYIGGDAVAEDKLKLQDANISHVLNVTTNVPNHFPGILTYLQLPVLDSRAVDLGPETLAQASEFISEARKTGTGVLVHCLWGVSRAPTMVCAYMLSKGLSLRGSLEQLSAARPAVQPNSSFAKQLIAMERRVRGSASLTLDEYMAACIRRNTSAASLAALISPAEAKDPSAFGGRSSLVVCVEGHRMFAKRVGDSPRMALVENFLTREEAEAAIAAAVESGRMHPSRTAPKKGMASNSATQPGMPSLVSSGRTSSNCRLDRSHPVGAVALQRAAKLVGLTPQHAEALQVVHYDKSQRYNAHYDYFQEGLPGFETRMGTQGQRLVTCFVYLNDPQSGGCTYFPKLDMRFKPKTGSALLWYNLERDGSLDTRTLHAGEPVLDGEKWGMNIWLRERPKQVPGNRT